ncbi:SDR family NAD(P)-dependent oxidoreductase [Sorangium sp. So ce296]|uniref:SDR family NAD(P)-dependent oxidoreductase n=1 Tax=Sorangium sp. So ce296 TaxID=3133296 RepID=UPI003F62F249
MSTQGSSGTSLKKREDIQEWLVLRLSERSGVAPASIDVRERFSRYGLSSRGAAELLAGLGAALGKPLSPTLVWSYPTIEALALHLDGGESPPPARPRASPAAALADEPIAIVGMACRFPGAPSLSAFWQLLCDGVDAITEVPADRWGVEALHRDDAGAAGARWGGFLEQVDRFDPQFFDISPREAAQIDPQQRLMLELSWEALEDAGIPPRGMRGTRSGVFFGAMWSDYGKVAGSAADRIAQHTATGQDLSILAARVSYVLGLEGPSMAVNTACSSSLVAVHLACQSLLRGESELALAGGVNLMLAPESTVAMSRLGVLSPDGRSKAFDARANGYVRGEGAGVVVLKPLAQALLDGDPIYGVIRGSAVNNDGFSNGLTAPNPAAQEALLRDAYARAGIGPDQVRYIEAHGTGTNLGDPIEARALAAVLCADRPAERPLLIGSVKTNLGHLEAAAGVAGLIKAALMVRHLEIPPSLHFEQPNPHIAFEELRLRVAQRREPWPDDGAPIVAGVSAFGFGGTNCHVVVEGVREGPAAHLLPLSARSADALRAQATAFGELSGQGAGRPPLVELCSSAAARLSGEEHRLAITARSHEELSARLSSFLEGRALPGLASGRAGERRPRLVFMFGGHGSQWLGMGRDLLRQEIVFRSAIERCGRAMRPHAGWSVLEVLTRGEARSLEDSDVVQPAIFAVQVALAALWRSWGVRPDAVVGQSIGEVAAAHAAGALTLEDAARVICRMGQLALRVSGRGGAALLELPLDEARRAIAGRAGRLAVAGTTSPSSTIVSGDAAALDEVIAELREQGTFARRIAMNYAPHGPSMDALRGELVRAVDGLRPARCSTPFYSSVAAAAVDGEALDAAYWGRNLSEPVRFAPAIDRLLDDGYDAFLELSPHPLLTHAVERSLAHRGRRGTVLPSLRREEAGRAVLLDALGALYTRGTPVCWGAVYRGPASPSRALPGVDRGAPAAEPRAPEAAGPQPFEQLVLSARSRAALADAARSVLSSTLAQPDLSTRDLCYTASVRRSHHEHRLAVVGRSADELGEAISSFLRGEARPGVASGEAQRGGRPKVVFVFPGQGSQWAGMGRALLDEEPVFREVIEACDRLLQPLSGWSLLEQLSAPGPVSRVHETEVAQPALFALEVALAELARSWGIVPDAVIGHSVGEVAAAHVAGALSLRDAVRVVHHRSRLMQRSTGLGKMASAEISPERAARLLRGLEGELSLAAVNDPGSVVLSGEAAALAEVLERLRREGVQCRELRVNYAFHSPQMAPFQGELAAALERLDAAGPALSMYSTVTGAKVGGAPLDGAYWARNIREPVLFAGAVDAAILDGHRTFLELGPHPVLSANVEQCLAARAQEGHAVSTLRRAQEERWCLLQSLGALYVQGYPVEWRQLYPGGARCVALPAYPWQRERCWVDGPGGAPAPALRGPREAEARSAALSSLLDAKGAAALAASVAAEARLSAEELPVVARVLEALRKTAEQARLDADAERGDAVYALEWQRRPALAPRPPAAGHWVVLVDEGGVGDRVAEALESAGGVCSRIRAGGVRARGSAGEGALDPGSTEGLARLWAELLRERGPARAVIHLASLDGAQGTDAALRQGVHSALAWIQAAGEAAASADRGPAARPERRDAPKLWFVTRGAVSVGPGDRLTAPEHATLWGLGRAMSLERPALWGGLIDLPAEIGQDTVAAVVSQVLAPDGEDHVALRPSGRFVQRLVRHRGLRSRRAPWSTPGTALITGGLGALGLRVAEWLARRGVQHLVLTGRRGASTEDARSSIAVLEALGAAVTVAQADVADAGAMAAVLADIDARLPPLSAVFHAAGVEDHTPLAALDGARLAEVLAPKVHGTLVLDALMRDRPLTAFVCFSSIASVWGSGGQAGYAAANAFLDAWVTARRAAGAPAFAVNWGPWQGGGMMTERGLAALERRGVRALGPGVALAILGRILDADAAQVVVADVDWPRFRAVVETGGPRPLLAEMPRAAEAASGPAEAALLDELRAAPPRERRRRMQRWLQGVVAQTLGFGDAERVDPTRGFFDLGMDSLMAVELRTRLHQALGLPLPSSVTFNHPNVVALAEHLLERLSLGEPAAASGGGEAPRPAGGEGGEPALDREREPIAIVGLGCRLPGGVADAEGFWQLLADGVDAVGPIPEERWDADAYYDPDPDAPGKTYAREGAFLSTSPDLFDARFFGISPREAANIDPQHRLLMEVIWEAFEHAGLVPGGDPLTGVFVGIGLSDYGVLQRESERLEAMDAYTMSGTFTSFSAGRLSYVLGLQGPSAAVDTACSSSLVAVHLACQSLRASECNVAVAGGVQLMLAPLMYVYLARARALAPDGRCKTFSAEANGYGRGEGCGMVVLKRLSDARRDGDRVLAVIRGSAVNNDGHSSGLTVPNGQAQQAVIRKALSDARLSPGDVDYVEAHGTGTPLGDPIEVEALAAVYGAGRPAERPLRIGAVKTNIGHLEAAAGIAGLMKVVLSLQHGELPAHLHASALNPRIPWTELPVEVTTRAAAWRGEGRRRRAGVSSFGMSGTNAHVLLEEAPAGVAEAPAGAAEAPAGAAEAPAIGDLLTLLPLSARTPEALSAMADAYGRFLRRGPAEAGASLRDIAYTASARRSHHEHRLVVLGSSREELAASLDAFAAGEARPGVTRGRAAPAVQPKIVFVFSGWGSQWAGMGLSLLDEEPVFREAMEACDAAVRKEAGFSLLEALRAEGGPIALGRVDVVQPALFAIGVALTALWRSWGVEPDAIVGHSMGEVAAACAARALTLEDGARIIVHRSRLLSRLSGKGAMAVVELPLARAEEAIRGHERRLAVAVSNSRRSTVLSGEPAAMDELLARLEREQVFVRRVRTDGAGHSPQVDPLMDELREALAGLSPAACRVPMRSTVSGDVCEGPELGAEYWAQNMRRPVLFSQAVERLLESDHAMFLEISPHPVLVHAVEEALRDGQREGVSLASLRRAQDARRSLLESLGALHAHGHPVDWKRLYPSGGRCVSLPGYPWQREPYWLPGGRGCGARRAARSDGAEELLYRLEWRRKELGAEGAGAGRSRGAWLVLSDRGGTGAALSAQLERRGEATVRALAAERYERVEPRRYLLDVSDASGYAALLADAFSEEHPCRGVVHLFGLDATAAEATSAETLLEDQRRGSLSALFLAKALVGRGLRDTPRLYLVTRGAQSAGPEAQPVRVSQAPLWGAGRAVGAEHPELGCTRVDLGEGAPEDGVEALVDELVARDREPEVALRASGRYVARLVRGPARAGGDGGGVRLRADGSYLITGGLGGLGLSVGRWMVERGARHVVLVGRSGPTEQARAAMREMAGQGAQVLAVQADVSQRASVAGLLSELGHRQPALRGVVHAAGVAVDSTVEEETEERLLRALAPKVQGAWNLHSLLSARAGKESPPLDFFVMYSSAMSVLGPPGSVNYAAADAFLDALAHHRRAQGLAATSIGWGLFSDVGAAARSGVAERMASRGMPGLTEAQGTEVLARMLAGGDAHALAMKFSLRHWIEFYPSAAMSPLWEELRNEPVEAAPGAGRAAELRKALEAMRPEDRPAALQQLVREQAALILRLDPGRIERDTPFMSLGFDSLMGLELRNRLEAGLSVALPATLVWTYPHIAALSTYLLGKLELGGGPGHAPRQAESEGAPAGAEGVAQLSADELLDELARELGRE